MDDQEAIRHLLGKALSTTCTSVGQLSDASQCCKEVERTGATAIVMDCDMPLMAGDQATRAIKSRHPHVHVVGFTGGVEGARRLSSAGADAVFDKCDIAGLAQHLAELQAP